jgi:hypothetical protein
MFAQLRKSATVTEKLKPMIQGRFTARSDKAAADWHKDFSKVWPLRKSKETG